MHELAITESILNIAKKAAAEHGVTRVKEIRIKLGEYSGIMTQCVQYYFDVISRGTVAEGAVLKMERLPIIMRCNQCSWEGVIDKHHIQCPACSSVSLKLLQGREFYVESLEVDQE
ncbi:MAG: hydrogenase maturation nickel metallochaperone HypA [Oscillospiraceae bacterium]|nr:hydrogenase maturation nickel metallochaperone HypA [Oscillospiraceae bacterium]